MTTGEFRSLISQLVEDGRSQVWIARRFGVSRETLRRWRGGDEPPQCILILASYVFPGYSSLHSGNSPSDNDVDDPFL